MAVQFRLLRADEIDCRVGNISKDGKGLSLLLYKDARCDMNILDECFGPFGWQRHHSRDNANCTVSIYDAEKNEWIEKEDVGTESNTEAIKGLASDSFKRACVNWGIGRELYTAPYIWIPANLCNIRDRKCYDKFHVAEISYDDQGNINKLIIANDTLGIDVYFYPKSLGKASPPKNGANEQASPQQSQKPTEAPQQFFCADCGAQITDYQDMDGKKISAKRHSESSQKKFGRPLCVLCIKKLQGGAT